MSDIKIEPRGKYAGVKIHLDAEQCQALIALAEEGKTNSFGFMKGQGKTIQIPFNLAYKMGKSIRELLEDEPDLLKERTPEQIAAILAKESEKAAMQLNAIKSGKQWQKVDKSQLESALLKHVK